MKETKKTAWITGASSGIGEGLAYKLASEGVALILSARKSDKLNNVVEKVKRQGVSCLCLPFDLSEKQDWEQLVNAAYSFQQNIDYVFLNGGVSQRAEAITTTEEASRKLMEINFFSQINLSKAVSNRILSEKKTTHFIPTNSIVSFYGFYLRSTYSASKHAMKGYFESLALENDEKGIAVTQVFAGKINTNISQKAFTGNGEASKENDNTHKDGVSIEKTAEKIWKATLRNKARVYIGNKEMLTLLINRISFNWLTAVLKKQKENFVQKK